MTLEQLSRVMRETRKYFAELDENEYFKSINKAKKDRIKEIFSNFIKTYDYKTMDKIEYELKLNEFVESQEL